VAIDELDARVASVAVHLGMIDDAKRLYAACHRYDLLNQLCAPVCN
jgi:intraflagellar transport protein 140